MTEQDKSLDEQAAAEAAATADDAVAAASGAAGEESAAVAVESASVADDPSAGAAELSAASADGDGALAAMAAAPESAGWGAGEAAARPVTFADFEALEREAGLAGSGGGVSPVRLLDAPMSAAVRRILRIEVPVIVKLADKRLPLGDIIDLSPGSIVEFSRGAEQPLELQVNNKVVGRGTAVKVGEKFGLRIDEILPVGETIRSLGG